MTIKKILKRSDFKYCNEAQTELQKQDKEIVLKPQGREYY